MPSSRTFVVGARVRRVVLIHGAGGGAWEWAIWRRVFAAHDWRVCAGTLEPAATGLAQTHLHDYARQVDAWRTDAALPADAHTVLIGASLGASLVLITAQRSPAAAMVLINPLPPAGFDTSSRLDDIPTVLPWAAQRSLASTLRAMPDADAGARLFAHAHWRDESGSVLREARALPFVTPTCPLLVIASTDDADVPVHSTLALARHGLAQTITLPGASHVGPLLGRDAADVAERCLHWLERVLEDSVSAP